MDIISLAGCGFIQIYFYSETVNDGKDIEGRIMPSSYLHIQDITNPRLVPRSSLV